MAATETLGTAGSWKTWAWTLPRASEESEAPTIGFGLLASGTCENKFVLFEATRDLLQKPQEVNTESQYPPITRTLRGLATPTTTPTHHSNPTASLVSHPPLSFQAGISYPRIQFLIH